MIAQINDGINFVKCKENKCSQIFVNDTLGPPHTLTAKTKFYFYVGVQLLRTIQYVAILIHINPEKTRFYFWHVVLNYFSSQNISYFENEAKRCRLSEQPFTRK